MTIMGLGWLKEHRLAFQVTSQMGEEDKSVEGDTVISQGVFEP